MIREWCAAQTARSLQHRSSIATPPCGVRPLPAQSEFGLRNTRAPSAKTDSAAATLWHRSVTTPAAPRRTQSQPRWTNAEVHDDARACGLPLERLHVLAHRNSAETDSQLQIEPEVGINCPTTLLVGDDSQARATVRARGFRTTRAYRPARTLPRPHARNQPVRSRVGARCWPGSHPPP